MPLAIAETRPLVTVSTFDIRHGIGMEIVSVAALPAAQPWPAANRAVYCPIYLAEPGLIVKFWIANGVHAGNVDIGLYNESYTRLVSAGSTAMAGDNVLQTFDTTDYFANPGRYYLGVAGSTITTATFLSVSPTVSVCRICGVLQQGTALPLPNPMVPVTVVSQFIPLAGFSYRVVL